MKRSDSGWNRRRDERGAIAVITAIMLTVMVGCTALLVDLGQLRASSRSQMLIADFAALAAGTKLSAGDPRGACQDAITYLNTNDARITSPINATTFCAPIANSCSGSTTQAAPSTTVGDVVVSVHYPVPASEIQDPYWTGVGLNDGTQCQRLRVVVRTTDRSMFARIFGVSSSTTSRSATVTPSSSTGPPPALWLLDPTGCVSLKVDGGSVVTVGTSTVKGIITIDSDGTACTGSSTTVSASGAGTLLKASGPPSGLATGEVHLNALASGATSCVLPACDPADVLAGRLSPLPVHGARATRSYVDWKYNCKASYPAFHGLTIGGCPYTAANGGTSYAYIDNLIAAAGANNVPGTGTWTTVGPGTECNPSASITYPVGNYYVKCSQGSSGFSVNSGVTVTFSGGNVVFDDNVVVSNGGTLKFNTANTNSSLPSSCTPPIVQTPCIGSSSANAAIVYVRGNNGSTISTSGTGTIVANHTFVYGGTGSIAFSGAPPTWTAPTEGPFAGLAYWTDMPSTATNAQKSSFTITGGSGASLTGVFFTPEAAPFKLAGGGNWGQQNAQFISYQLAVTGGGTLTMAPDSNAVAPPTLKGLLIR